jgi:hypothetical protein
MGKYSRLLMLILVVTAAVSVGCTNKASSADNSDSSGSSGGSTPPSTPTVTTASPLALKMWTIYDEQTYVNNLTFVVTENAGGTTLDSAATTCAPTATNPLITCTVTVPEGRLFYSSLHFLYSNLPSGCTLLDFQPYYYQASNAAAYVPPWAPAGTAGVDCQDTNPNKDASCWWGAAPNLITTWPQNGSLLTTPDEANMDTPQSVGLTLNSAWSLGQEKAETVASLKRGSNRLTVSAGFDATKQGSAQSAANLQSPSETYVAGTYVPYTFTCRDHYYDPITYQITLVVDEQDTSTGNGTNDNFWSWRDLP